MNEKLDKDIFVIRPRLFPMTLIGEEKTGGQPDAWEYTDYTNMDLDAKINSVKKYIEDQFYSKDEFYYVLERLEKRAKEYFETDFSKHISLIAKRGIDSNYYIKVNDGYIINEVLNNEYKSIIVLKKEKLKLLYEKLIKELTKKYEVAEGQLDERGFEKQVSDIHTEGKRRNDFSFYILPTYDYSPTLEDFRDEELFIKKKMVTTIGYLHWLRETKKIYKNARHYYTLWGARGTGVDKGATYDKILALIQEEIELSKAKINKPVNTKPPQNQSPENNHPKKNNKPLTSKAQENLLSEIIESIETNNIVAWS